MSASGEHREEMHMKKLFGSAGAGAAVAAVLSAAVTAALMMAVQPAAAQDSRVIVRSFGAASIGVSIRDVTGEDAVKMQKLLDAIESLDDVQNVYTNAVLEE